MGKNRNYSEEIALRNKRLLKRTKRWKQVERRIHPLIESFNVIRQSAWDKKIKSELYRYIPIGSIACLEGWYRIAVANLIDSNPKCRCNAESFREPKFEVRDVLAVHYRHLTAGELVAHMLQMNRLRDVNDSLTTIIGSDFTELFKSVCINPKRAPNPVTFGAEAGLIFKDVKDTFDLRHIFSHELATSMVVSAQRYENCIFSVFMYLVGAERVIQNLLGETA